MIGIDMPYWDIPFSNPQRLADALLKLEVKTAIKEDNFVILSEIYYQNRQRYVSVRKEDGSVIEITLTRKQEGL